MRTLVLLRHAKSSWKVASLEDHDRPLNKRGRRDAPRMGQLLAEQGLVPDLVLCSSARRARDTAFSVLHAAGYEGETRILRSLYMAGAEACAETIRRLEGEPTRLMVVAHNPGLEELLQALTGQVIELPTAGLAQLRLSIDSWRDLALGKRQGKLIALWRPKELSTTAE